MNASILQKYRDAIIAMKNGNFEFNIPDGADGDIEQIGSALEELKVTLENQFNTIVTLSKITEQINAGVTLDEVLNNVFDAFRLLIPYNRIGFSLLADENKTVYAYWARSDAPIIKISKGYSAPLEGSSLQQIIETGRPRIINDLEAYLLEHKNSESTAKIVEEGMRSSLTCPLIAMGKPIGFMFFSSMERNAYKNIHIDLFLGIARQLAIIVEKGRLYQNLSELNQIKNKFLGIAAHDLRSPIAIIKGYVGLFLGDIIGTIPNLKKFFYEK